MYKGWVVVRTFSVSERSLSHTRFGSDKLTGLGAGAVKFNMLSNLLMVKFGTKSTT